jgi:hypothetical protein
MEVASVALQLCKGEVAGIGLVALSIELEEGSVLRKIFNRGIRFIVNPTHKALLVSI